MIAFNRRHTIWSIDLVWLLTLQPQCLLLCVKGYMISIVELIVYVVCTTWLYAPRDFRYIRLAETADRG
jgi:hypothetical protein